MATNFFISRGQFDALEDLFDVMSGIQDAKLWKEQTHPLFVTYHSNSKVGRPAGETFALPNNTLIFVPIHLGERIRISQIAIEMTTPPAIGSNVLYGIYDSYPLENYPRDLLASGAEITGTTAGIEDSDTDIAEDLEAGLYWLAITIDVSFTMKAYSAGDANCVGYERNTSADTFDNVLGYTQLGSTLPNPAPDNMISISNTVPAIFALTEPNQS